MTDQQLLIDYSQSRSESAFAELVRRHIGLVYSAALRLVCDPRLAEEVTQDVFVALSKHATDAAARPILAGWLHRSARNIACQAIRADVRRRAREGKAVVMHAESSINSEPSWAEIAPQLDAAIARLSEPERDAVLLRYFEHKSAPEMAEALGISSEAAQKRVHRGIERLRHILARNGGALTASGLAGALSANSIQAVPAGLALSISTAAATASLAAGGAVSATKILAMTVLQKSIVLTSVAAALTLGIYHVRQSSNLRKQIENLEQQRPPLVARIAELTKENERLSNLVAQAENIATHSEEEHRELLRLRGNSSAAAAASQEVARLQSELANKSQDVPDLLTNAMSFGLATAENWRRLNASQQLARMNRFLHLSESQEQAIGVILTNNIPVQSAVAMNLLTGKITPAQLRQEKIEDAARQRSEIQAQLTPDQRAKYPEYQRSERLVSANLQAHSDVRQLTAQFKLSDPQQEELQRLLLKANLHEHANSSSTAPAEAIEDAQNFAMDHGEERLAVKAEILKDFLTPEQLAAWRKTQVDRLQMQSNVLKILARKNVH